MDAGGIQRLPGRTARNRERGRDRRRDPGGAADRAGGGYDRILGEAPTHTDLGHHLVTDPKARHGRSHRDHRACDIYPSRGSPRATDAESEPHECGVATHQSCVAGMDAARAHPQEEVRGTGRRHRDPDRFNGLRTAVALLGPGPHRLVRHVGCRRFGHGRVRRHADTPSGASVGYSKRSSIVMPNSRES